MRMPIGRGALLLFLVCHPSTGNCQDSFVTRNKQNKPPLSEYVEEFFLSDAVRNQDRGELQVTFAVDSRQAVGTNTALKIEYGITSRLQFNSELPYGSNEEESQESFSGLSTLSLGVQYQIIRSNSPFALSAGLAFGVPVKPYGEVEYQPTILAAKTFRRMQIHASFAADIEREKPSFQYNLASVYPIRRHWFPTFEFNGRSVRGKGAFYLTPGLYRRLERFEFGVGVPAGVGGIAGRAGVVVKVSWEIGGGREPESVPGNRDARP
jgi:hypothetical protein